MTSLGVPASCDFQASYCSPQIASGLSEAVFNSSDPELYEGCNMKLETCKPGTPNDTAPEQKDHKQESRNNSLLFGALIFKMVDHRGVCKALQTSSFLPQSS